MLLITSRHRHCVDTPSDGVFDFVELKSIKEIVDYNKNLIPRRIQVVFTYSTRYFDTHIVGLHFVMIVAKPVAFYPHDNRQ